MKNRILFFCLFLAFQLVAQEQAGLSLEQIWASGDLYPKSVPGFNFQEDGKHYTRIEKGSILQYDITTGEQSGVLFSGDVMDGKPGAWTGEFDDFQFSQDESKILFKTNTESIYRYSDRADFYVYNAKGKSLERLHEDAKQMYATFSPDASKVGFVADNNLMVKDLKSGKTTQVTSDGQTNAIINGASDWVYEEEFTLVRAFEWSPNGRYIAYLRFDEREVPEFTMFYYRDNMYPDPYTFKYPKVGEKNAVVSAHIYDVQTGQNYDVKTGSEADDYLPRIKWTPNNMLSITWMNRHQNHLKLLLCNPENGNCQTILEEKNRYYIDLHDNLTFLKNGKEMLWTSEKNGKNQIFKYALNGKELDVLSGKDIEVTDFYGLDETNNILYYQGIGKDAQQREVYSVQLDGKKHRQLSSAEKGTTSASFSPTFDYFIQTYSDANTPSQYGIYDRKGTLVRALEDNQALRTKMEEMNMLPVEFFNFKTTTGVELDGWMIKPQGPRGKKYPLLMYVYGGPGSQLVKDAWLGHNMWWFQMLAQKGYVVACVDNRGTGGKGEEFKKMTYLTLGKYETEDQIEAAKYLGSQSYIDATRIGIFGWSYGGFMASHAILQGNEVFKTAIAVAPVTNWKWYDSIYTERYMQTNKENTKGYEENSPIYYADRLKGNYLLIHGIGDDNVHYQHSVEMANALISKNKQFEMMFYPNKNHGIYGGYTRLHLFTLMTDFLERKL